MTIGGDGFKSYQKLRDVIYGQNNIGFIKVIINVHL